MLLRSIGIASALALTIGVASSRAGTLYSQPAIFPGSDAFNALTSSSVPSPGVSYTTYDNFALLTGGSIYNVSFQGFTFNSSNDQPTSIPVQGFNVVLYADNGGVPGVPVYSSGQVGFTANAVGTVDFFNNNYAETVYDYTVGLTDGGYVASSNTTYWISIQAVINSPAYWTWTQGTGGDGTSYQTNSSGFSKVQPGDRAFSLSSFSAAPPVPEPSSFLLAVTATLAALGVRTRRWRRVR